MMKLKKGNKMTKKTNKTETPEVVPVVLESILPEDTKNKMTIGLLDIFGFENF